jgi:Xaa-Pro aminopeptidase
MLMRTPLLLYRNEHFNANFFHFSNVDIDHSFLVVDGARQVLLVPLMNYRMANEQFAGMIVPYKDPLAELKKLLRGKRVGVDGDSVSFHLAERLKSFCRPEDVSHELRRRRTPKTMEELEKIKKASDISKEIITSLDIRRGMTEAEVKSRLLKETAERGLESAFKPIVAADRNSAFPHYRTGNSRIRRMVLVDYGVRFDHYSADITRCFFLSHGKEEAAYHKLQGIFSDIMEKLPELEYGSDVSGFSARLFRKHKLPELPHSIGHGIGLEVHEYPSLGRKSRDHIAGATMAIEPSAYFKDFGVRFEDDVYFDGKKARVL